MTHTLLLATVYLAFISLGLPDSVLGVAWPGMRASLGQDLSSAGLITLVLTVGSALSSFVGYLATEPASRARPISPAERG